MRTGAQLLCDALEAAGVRHAFGLPGTEDIALHEALRRSSIQFVNTTHELAATFMANGYFRASGRLAPVFAIPGPGFLYALTGLAEAAHDSVAALLVVGAPPPAGKGYPFQRLDQVALARPIVKGAVHAFAAGDVAGATRRAVSLAFQDEPGPVLLQWEPEALAGVARGAGAPAEDGPAPPDAAFEESCDRAGELLAGARRTVILAGQGALDAAGPIAALAARLGAPVATTTSGRGLLPEDHPWSLAFELARGGLDGLNALLEEADAVLVLGCKLGAASSGDSRLALPADRTVRVDTSQAVLAAGHPAAVQVQGTVEAFVASLARRIGVGPPCPGTGWTPAEVAAWRARLALGAAGQLPEPAVLGLAPGTTQALFGALRRALPREGLVVTDSGQHQAAARRWLEVWSPRGLIVPSDFQSMGFGLPAAIGAALAAPERPVVAVIGDGAFAMTAMELLTAARLRLQLVVVVLADGFLNRIRLQQLATHGHAHAVEVRNPDFAGLAAAVGAAHERVEGDAETVFRRALRRPGVTLLEVRLGDSAAIQGARARGLARSLRRLPLARRLASWLAEQRRG